MDLFQDVNACSLPYSRRINKRQFAKDKDQMARVCDAMARAKALEAGDLHLRTLQALGVPAAQEWSGEDISLGICHTLFWPE